MMVGVGGVDPAIRLRRPQDDTGQDGALKVRLLARIFHSSHGVVKVLSD